MGQRGSDDEKFDIVGDDVKLSKDSRTITKIRRNFKLNNNSFGTIDVASDSDHIYIWDLLIKKEVVHSVTFGIASHKLVSKTTSNLRIDGMGGTYYMFRQGHKFSHNLAWYYKI